MKSLHATWQLVLAAAALAAMAALAALAPGCEQMADRMGMEFKQDEGHNWRTLVMRPRKNMEAAVSSPNPDERREGVMWLTDKTRVSLDSVVKLLSFVIRQDPDPTVRSAAARALGKSINPAAIDPLVEALEDKNDFVRLDAAVGLAYKDNENARRSLLVRLAKDPEPQVRAAAAAALANYRQHRVLEALIGALHDPDFAVVYHAEHSLIALTGHTYEYDADAWTRWLAGLGPDGDPFAMAGQTPPSLQDSHAQMGQRMRESFRRAWYWWQADEKPPE